MTCRVLVADPPWRFNDKLPGVRGAEDHYKAEDGKRSTLSVEELIKFPRPALARDAVLFLWRVASMQEEALAVALSWGFIVKSELVWRKTTATGKRHFGMGRYVRMEHEVCLIVTRGSPKILDHSTRSVFDAPVGRHSEKPSEFFEIVEALCGSPDPLTHVELFARVQRPGWTCYGNELEQSHPGAPCRKIK